MKRMATRSVFQFRLRDLLWSVSLLAISLGLGLAGWRIAAASRDLFFFFPTFVGSSACFGAGVGCLFQSSAAARIVVTIVAALFCANMLGVALAN
jgi:hypothetical protein